MSLRSITVAAAMLLEMCVLLCN